jgi:hypothetical protein
MWLGGHRGFEGCTISDFLDVAWAALYDDCPAMGDQFKYREALHEIFIEGKEPGEMEFTDATGKVRKIPARRKVNIDPHRALPRDAMSRLAELRQTVEAVRAEREQPDATGAE